MADPELVKILQQGSEVWNHWREQQPDLQLDLRNVKLNNIQLRFARLNNVDLSGAHLRFANLGETNLDNAILYEADLQSADLSYTRLRNAKLCGANLAGAHLAGARLNNANLTNATLTATDLTGADLAQTNWTNATVGLTICGDLDLRNITGLETVKHTSPSTIGLDTIYRSHGQIPPSFLMGAGVPKTFIIYMSSLVGAMRPIDFYSCFISYSHHNEDFARRLHADLQARGVRCWFADEDLKIGDHYHQRIDEAIHLYDKLIIVLSEHAVDSLWVEREVVAAREKEERQGHEVLFPIRLDEAVMQTSQAWAADVRRRWHIGDFTRWKDHDHYQQAFERLMRDLKAQG